MPAIRSNYSDQFLADALPVLEALIFDEHDRIPDMIPKIFRVMPSNSWGEQSSTMAGPKAVVLRNEGEATVEDAPIQGYDKTYTMLTYALSIGFSRETIQDDKLGMVQDNYRELGKSCYQTRQVTAFNVFNNSFSDTGPDGVSLCNTAHVMINQATYANRPTTDISLSVAGLRLMHVDTGRQINHRSLNSLLMIQNILTSPDQQDTAEELVGSPDRPDTDNRAINTFKRRNYQLYVSPFITSTTAWWGTAAPSQTQLRFYQREAPNTWSWIDDATRGVNTGIEERNAVGYSDYIGVWGTSG